MRVQRSSSRTFISMLGLLALASCAGEPAATKTTAIENALTAEDEDLGAPPRAALGLKVADYMIATWPELDATPEDCSGPGNCFSMNFATVPASPAPKFWEYTYGVPLVGLQKLYELTHERAYFDYVKKYVDRYVSADGSLDLAKPWPLTAAGEPPAANEPTIQDVIQPANLLFALYADTKDERYLNALKSAREATRSISTNSAGAFWHKPSYPEQQWLDGIYMTQPLLTRYGVQYADAQSAGDREACLNTVVEQIKLAAEHTFDERTGLYVHAWNGAADGVWVGLDLPKKVPPLEKVSPFVWARSLAWFVAGIVDVLEYLPADHPERPALTELVSTIAAGLEKYQDPESGLWYQIVDVMDGPLPTEGGYPGETDRAPQSNWTETSASALFAYSLAKAVRLEVLPRHYRRVARKAWSGVRSRIDLHDDGTVTIRGTVVGMSVGGTFNAYVNADFRSDLVSGELPAPASCPATIPADTTPTVDCRYLYVRDNVPQAFGAVLLASSELELRGARRH